MDADKALGLNDGQQQAALRELKIKEMKAHPAYFQLTNKQQRFILAFIDSGGNARAAAQSVFNCKTAQSADNLAKKVLKKWQVRKLLQIVGEYSFTGILMTKEEAMYLISERMRDESITADQFSTMLKFMSGALGWVEPAKGKKDDIDSLVQKLEREKNGKA